MKNLILTAKKVTRPDQTGKKISILAYGGGIIKPPNWGAVIIDLDGLESPETLPILVDHQNKVSALIGQGKPAVSGVNYLSKGQFHRQRAGRIIKELAEDGVGLERRSASNRPKLNTRGKAIKHRQWPDSQT